MKEKEKYTIIHYLNDFYLTNEDSSTLGMKLCTYCFENNIKNNKPIIIGTLTGKKYIF